MHYAFLRHFETPIPLYHGPLLLGSHLLEQRYHCTSVVQLKGSKMSTDDCEKPHLNHTMMKDYFSAALVFSKTHLKPSTGQQLLRYLKKIISRAGFPIEI